MDQLVHRFHDLFAQLGLPNDAAGIAQFLSTHRPLSADTALINAPFWTEAQREFLRDELAEDADWSGTIDALDAALR